MPLLPKTGGGPAGRLALLALCVSCASCATEAGPIAPTTCADAEQIDGECVGVIDGALCQEAFCPGDGCARVLEVPDAASLQEQLAQAGPGDCLVLGEGNFPEIMVPAGASVHGRGAGVTGTGEIIVSPAATSDNTEISVVAGVTTMGGGIRIADGARATIRNVRVAGSNLAGIQVSAGAEVTVEETTIEESALYGIYAKGARSLTVTRTSVRKNEAGGIYVLCEEGCKLATALDVSQALVQQNGVVGMALQGSVAGMASRVVVERTEIVGFEGGGGIGIYDGASLQAQRVMALDNEDFGVQLDAAGETLIEGAEVSGNVFGISISSMASAGGQPTVRIVDSTVAQNSVVGIGLSDAAGVVIESSVIRDTRALQVEVLIDGFPGMGLVGDGVSWINGAQATLDALTLSGNQRAAILIDGEVGEGSSIAGTTLEGTDAKAGIVIQGVDAQAAVLPEVQGGKLVVSDEVLPVAVPPVAPVLR